MGNRQPQVKNIATLNSEEWVEAGEDQSNSMFCNVNPYRKRLLANIFTHQLIEEYELSFISDEDYKSYIRELSYRQSISPNNPHQREAQGQTQGHYEEPSQALRYVYPVKYFANGSKQEMCTTIYTGYLYAQKVDLRLRQINDIPFSDLLCIYDAAFKGFRTLYERVGYFDIQEEMIFINRKGEVKVWMNANISKNYPNFEKTENITAQGSTESHYSSQAEMVRSLILLIEENSDLQGPEVERLFSYHLENRHIFDKLSFDYCIEEFEEYLRFNNLFCPSAMRTIAELFAGNIPSHQNIGGVTANYEQSHVNELTTSHVNRFQEGKHQRDKYNEPHFGRGMVTQSSSRTETRLATEGGHFAEQRPIQSPFFKSGGQLHQSDINVFNNQTGKISNSPISTEQKVNSQSLKISHQGDGNNRKADDSSSDKVFEGNIRQSNIDCLKVDRNLTAQTKTLKETESQMMFMRQQSPNSFNQSISVPTAIQFISPSQQLRHERIQYHYPHSDVRVESVRSQNYDPGPQTRAIPIPSQNSNGRPYRTNETQRLHQSPPVILKRQQQRTPTQTVRTNLTSSNVPRVTLNNKQILQSTVTDNPPAEIPQRAQKDTAKASESGSRIQYHTTKRSYQLDEQIASDLKKFLGLTVS